MDEPITQTYGHGGINLTAYPSSGRVGVEVTAVNAVMDYSDFLDFADKIRRPRTVTTAAELDALPVGSVVLDGDGDVWQKRGEWWCSYESAEMTGTRIRKFGPLTVLREATR